MTGTGFAMHVWFGANMHFSNITWQTNFLMQYNIVVVSDDGYVQHAAVMLVSLFSTNPGKAFAIYLITDGISAVAEQRLRSVCLRYGAELRVINCSIDNLGDFPVGQWQPIMYFKLLIPQLLPETESRCLFLDVDMIVDDDIQKLYDWPLDGNVIAAAEDMPDCVAFKPRLGLNADDLYINSGVMVCDLVEWRAMEREVPIMDYATSIIDKIVNEQDVIACYFRGRISMLPIRWNMTTFYFMREPKIFAKYLPQLLQSKAFPGIIHFAAPIKPWFKDCQHPYRHLYRKYLKRTPWKEYRFPVYEQLSLWGRVKKTIRNWLNRHDLIQDAGYTATVRHRLV